MILKTQEQAARWWANKDPNGRVSYQRWLRNTDAFRDLFTYILRCPYYNGATDQQAFGVALKHDADIATALAEVRVVLPFLKPYEGGKYLVVYEYSESTYGVYGLRGVSESDVRLVKTTYGHTEIIAQFASWEQALTYVREHHPVVLAEELLA